MNISTLIREVIEESLVEEGRHKIDYKPLIDYAKKFNSSEDLLRSGGFPIDLLDRVAFGFSADDIKTLHPKDLTVIWDDDADNVEYEIFYWESKAGKTRKQWAKEVDLSEPIEVSFDGKNFNIEDGHHRYIAAKELNKKLNVDLTIKARPLEAILGRNYDYDKFHRDIFNMIEESIIEEGKLAPAQAKRADDIVDDIIKGLRKGGKGKVAWSRTNYIRSIGETLQHYQINVDEFTDFKYDEVKGMTLYIVPNYKSSTTGHYYGKFNEIYLYYWGSINRQIDIIDAIKKMKSTLIHELTHAIIYKKAKGKNLRGYKDSSDGYKSYYNQPEEINANYISAVSSIRKELKNIYRAETVLRTFDSFFETFKRHFDFYDLNPKMQKKVQSRLYATWDELKDEFLDDEFADFRDWESSVDDAYDTIERSKYDYVGELMDSVGMTDREQAFKSYISQGITFKNRDIQQEADLIIDSYWGAYEESILPKFI
jgi:hypothetical protein